MNPLQFYRKFLSNNDLVRANIGLEAFETINDLEELAEVLSARTGDDYFLEVVADELTDMEVNLIKRLTRTTTLTQYHTVDYKPEKYPMLTGFVLLLEDKDGKGVIHRTAVEGLKKFIFDVDALEQLLTDDDEELETDSEYLNKLPEHVRNLVHGIGEDITLKNELEMYPFNGLQIIVKNLNFAVDHGMGQTEEDVIYSVLTNPEYMKKALVNLPYETILFLKSAVENDDRYFKVNQKTESLFHFGMSMEIDSHGCIYPEVFQTLKHVNLKRMVAIAKGGVSLAEYNAMRVKVTLKDTHVPIVRELIIPARLNFFELHLVIQRAMGWWTSHLAKFSAGEKSIHMYGTYEENAEFSRPGTIHLNGIETMVDGVLIEHGELTYLYDYGDHWEHDVELMELLKEPPVVYPSVDKRKGPIPIEDSGGVHGFEETMRILEDETHPEHEDVTMWVRSTNYRKTYQKQQINKKLKELFAGGAPIMDDDVY